ncbi:hypothetical protein FHS15_001956 [Paenibacillus castaneae]|nr:hypothetical protein [Paenibacillus castaneae]
MEEHYGLELGNETTAFGTYFRAKCYCFVYTNE